MVFGTPTTLHHAIVLQLVGHPEGVLAADGDQRVDLERVDGRPDAIQPAFDFVRVRPARAEDRAAARQQPAYRLDVERNDVGVHGATPSVAESDEVVAVHLNALANDRTDHRIQPRAVPAPCQHADSHDPRLARRDSAQKRTVVHLSETAVTLYARIVDRPRQGGSRTRRPRPVRHVRGSFATPAFAAAVRRPGSLPRTARCRARPSRRRRRPTPAPEPPRRSSASQLHDGSATGLRTPRTQTRSEAEQEVEARRARPSSSPTPSSPCRPGWHRLQVDEVPRPRAGPQGRSASRSTARPPTRPTTSSRHSPATIPGWRRRYASAG